MGQIAHQYGCIPLFLVLQEIAQSCQSASRHLEQTAGFDLPDLVEMLFATVFHRGLRLNFRHCPERTAPGIKSTADSAILSASTLPRGSVRRNIAKS